MQCILITGGTGLIGRALTKHLIHNGYEVIVLTRGSVKKSPPGLPLSYSVWDVKKQIIDSNVIGKADHIIHLAGAGIADKRWSQKRKREIVESRTGTSAFLVKILNEYPNKVRAVVSASAIGWYGPDPEVQKPGGFIETDPAATDFLGRTCRLWEESINAASKNGIRLVKLRTGIVLANEGGALKEFKKPLKFGIAPILGNGNQIISWIEINDLVRIYVHALENEKITGVYNAVAPNPVTNKEFILTLAKSKRRPLYIPVKVPAVILKMTLGEMAIEVLKSATVNSDKIQHTGFVFESQSLEKAITRIKTNYTNWI